MSEVKYKLAAGTNVGLVRQNNEDNFIVCNDLSTSEWLIPQVGDYADLGEFGSLLVVADGMGGANAGEVASAIAVETMQKLFQPERLKTAVTDDKSIQEFMKTAVKQADLNILHKSKEDSSTSGMGTTIVMAWILGDKAYICWCGDSRCYVLNKRKGLVQLSKDHSYVQELVDKGELDPALMHDHPLSNVITRCLGDVDNRANADTIIYQLHHGDTIMLCSDGLCGICHDEQILDTMIEHREDPNVCKNELISLALSNGGYDNVTVAVCNIEIEEEKEDVEENADNEEAEGESKAEETPDEEEDLSTTIRSEVIGRKSHRLRNVLLFLLLLLVVAAAVIWFNESLRQEFMAFINPYLAQIKGLIQ